MPSPFSVRDARVSGAIDRAFGEQFTFTARNIASGDVNLPMMIDATRPRFTCTGTWDGPAASGYLNTRGASAEDNAHARAGTRPSVCIDDNLFVWTPGQGDRCLRVFDGSTYEVSKALPDAMGRTTIYLTARK